MNMAFRSVIRPSTRLRSLGIGLVAAVALVFAAAGSAGAYVNIVPGWEHIEVVPSDSRAGGHPDVRIEYTYRLDSSECEVNCIAPRILRFNWPEGFIGNPHVTPKCKLTEFSIQSCPSDAQIGKFTLDIEGTRIYVPVYNMVTRPDQAGAVAFIAPLASIPYLLDLSARTDSDYGLKAETSPIVRLPFNHQELMLWGVPQAKEHDIERFVSPLEGSGYCGPTPDGCHPGEDFSSPTFASSSTPPAPFLQNPTTCGVSLTMRADIEYHGGAEGGSVLPWPSTTGCDQASFSPSITAKPTTISTDTASGLDSDLRVPQAQSADTPSPSELRLSRLTLPEGMSINPNAADGKVACPDILNGIGTLGPASCPEFSKIGTLDLDVAALPAPIPGALYLAEPKPAEPYRVLLTASGFATHVKLLGEVVPDRRTGQLSIFFRELPQAPLQGIDLHVFGSERGLLATPSHCGVYGVEGEFVPWNSALATRFSKSTITLSAGPGGSPCTVGARPLSPALQAGVANSTAGNHAPFSLTLRRSDGEQGLARLSVSTPPGFAATLKGVPYCPEQALASLASASRSGLAEQHSPACPPASLIGTATAGAGAGSHPLYVPGKVYLAGPYKGAPLSLIVVVPAVSGPYDLGTIAVRAAIAIDSVTARVTAESDSLPQILDGIPLRTRSILVNLDRPGFTLNPTSCDPLAVDEATFGDEGGRSDRSVNFQVANCSDLPYRPKLRLKLTGGMKRRGHPAIKATFTARAGEANTKSVSVALPPDELLDNSRIRTICTRVAFAAKACPAGSLVGTAEAITPILDSPLRGNAYLRSSPGRGLPDLVLALEGQVDLELSGRIDTTKDGALRTTFEAVPDAPVSSLVLNLVGGARGIVQNSKSLCGKPKNATVRMTGQNGAIVSSKSRLQVACQSKVRNKRHRTQPVRKGAR